MQADNFNAIKNKRRYKKVCRVNLLAYKKAYPEATSKETARQFDCNMSTINRIYKQLGINNPHNNNMKIHPQKLKAYIIKHPNASRVEIAGKFGCTPSAVSLAGKRMGLTYKKQKPGRKPSFDVSKEIRKETRIQL